MIQDPISQNQLSSYCQTFFSQLLIVKHFQKDLETVLKRSKGNNSMIQNQLEVLSKMQQHEGFPKLFQCQMNQSGSAISLQIQKLGVSLKQVMKQSKVSGVKIPTDLIVNIGLQMVDRVENLHINGYMHMDLKPDHFMFQTQSFDSCLYLIDFGLSAKNSDNINIIQTSETKHKVFKGNINYSSVSRMKCLEPSINDELESILYIIGQMLQGELPWKQQFSLQSKKPKLKDSYSKILSKKIKQTWKTYKFWINQTMNKIKNHKDPYYQFKTQICKLTELDL